VKTSEVAAQAQVNAQTLRYYERRGLLPEPVRTASGYRDYGDDAVRVVRFVKRAQQLGFTLNDIEDLLHLAGVVPTRVMEPGRWPAAGSMTCNCASTNSPACATRLPV
jgi:DNA-binding transcriptional MerR regulator